MPYEPGGRADKLGNRYEGLFIVKQLLRLIDEEISSVTIEAVGDDEEGVDLWIRNRIGTRACYQCKSRNASNEYWRIGDLDARGVFEKAKKQLDADPDTIYNFVSPLTNTMLKDITTRARNSNGDPEHFYMYQIVHKNGSTESEIEKHYNNFCRYMNLDVKDTHDRASAYDYLKRIHFVQFSDDPESKRDRLRDIRHLLTGDDSFIYLDIVNYAVENDLLGQEITECMLIEHLETHPNVFLRRLNNDTRILPRTKILNDAFLGSFFPVNDSFIQRTETTDIFGEIQNGSSVIIHGKAGCGKSGVTFDLANRLKASGIAYLAIKLDRLVPETSAEHFGNNLGLPASPIFCLDSISAGNEAVLILDQLDAIRWTSAHSKTALDVCKELIDEVYHLNKSRTGKLSIVVICRTYDYRNDRGIRNLLKAKDKNETNTTWKEYEIGELDDETVKDVVGAFYDIIPPKLKKLLRNPNNLYIWTSIENKKSLSAIKSTSDLVGIWWKELRESFAAKGNDEKTLVDLKEYLTDLIDKSGKLFIPSILLNDISPRSKDYLLSSGMLIESNNGIGFFHQSFYDFFSMERMFHKLYEGYSILDVLCGKEDQTPLRRYHLQMLLETILASDVDKFIGVGKSLLRDTNSRFIMKHAYLAVMGQTSPVHQQIYDYIIELYNNPYWRSHIIDTAFYGNKQLILKLIEEGQLHKWISLEKERDTALGLLRSVNTNIPDEITSVVNEFAFVTSEIDKKLYSVLCRDFAEDSDSMFEFRLKMMQYNTNFMHYYLNWDSLAKKYPQRALALLKLLVFEKDKITDWSHHHIDQEDINNLKQAAKVYARRIWQEFMPFLLEKTQGLHDHYNDEFSFWETEQYPKQIFGRIFIELIKAAATSLIQENTEGFFELCKPYHNCDSVVINEVLLFIMNELPAQYSDFVISWLSDNPQKRFFEYTSENDEHIFLAKSAIEKHSKTCSDESFKQLENTIYFYHEEKELQIAKLRFRDNHDSRQNGTNILFTYPYWGKVQNYLLPALEKTRITKRTNDLIMVLGRRFVNAPIPYMRSMLTGGYVGSSIGAVADKLSNKQWLRIIQNKRSSKPFFERRSESGNILESSPMQFSGDLEALGDKDPSRVANLALQFKGDTDIHYINAALRVIGKKEPSDQNKHIANWNPVDKEIAEQLLLRFGRYTDAATVFSRAIENRAKEDWCDDILDIISEIAKNHSNPEPEKWNEISSDDEDSKTVQSLHSNSINCTRGCATKAIANLLWEDNSRYSILKDAIKSAVFDEHLAVNMAAVECILPMCNFDRNTAIEWFTNLVSKDIRLAAHPFARRMYYGIFESHKDFVLDTVSKMYNSEYDDVSETGAQHIVNLYLLYGCFSEIIFSETPKSTAQVKGMLHLSIESLKYSQHYERAKEIITYHLEQIDKESSYLLPGILRNDNVAVDLDPDFLIKVISIKQTRSMMRHFVEFIEEHDISLISFADIIFTVCDSLVKHAKDEVNDPASELYGVAEPLSKLITSLYEQSKEKTELAEVNQKCLDTWDIMFEYRIGTIRELSQSIMEQ